MDPHLTIGGMAARTGLGVSALRFYDQAGVLCPDTTDPGNGYRRYTHDQVRVGRLVAGLRRLGLPVSQIRRAVDAADDPETVLALVDARLRALEDDLALARGEAVRIAAAMTPAQVAVRVEVTAADLTRLLSAVRFAVSHDPDHPQLRAVLLESGDRALTAVATDRYRLARHRVQADVETAGASSLAPVHWVDDLLMRLQCVPDGEPVGLLLEPGTVTAQMLGRSHRAATVPGAFPDHRLLTGTLDPSRGSSWTDSTVLPDQPEAGQATVVLPSGSLVVDRPYLTDAVTAAGGAPTLQHDADATPLTVLAPDGALSLLMPLAPASTA